MGEVKRMLFSKQLQSKSPDLYPDKRSLERAETMHVHERNMRLEYSREEFVEFAHAMDIAVKTLGSRKPSPGLATEWLDLSDISSEPEVTPQRFDIEESTYPTLKETTIHLHYRNFRIEFTHKEWEEFVGGMEEAIRRWRNA